MPPIDPRRRQPQHKLPADDVPDAGSGFSTPRGVLEQRIASFFACAVMTPARLDDMMSHAFKDNCISKLRVSYRKCVQNLETTTYQ